MNKSFHLTDTKINFHNDKNMVLLDCYTEVKYYIEDGRPLSTQRRNILKISLIVAQRNISVEKLISVFDRTKDHHIQ